MITRLRRSWLLVVLLTAVAFSAHAQPSEENIATARGLGVEGQAALDAGDHAKAADRFRRAESLYHAPTLVLGLARAYVGLGKYVRARESYNKIIREKLPADAPAAFKQAQEDARKEIGSLEGKTSWVTITVAGAEDPEVTIDGEPVPAAALGVRRAVDPGDHEVMARAEGYLPATSDFSVDQGASTEVSLELQIDPNAGSGSGASPGAGQGDPGGTQRILGFVALGVGGAGLLVGVITGALAMGQHSDLEEACPDSQCLPAEQDNLDSYRTMGTVSTIGFIAGGVLAATGVVLVLTAPSADEPGPEVSARFGPGSLQATVRF